MGFDPISLIAISAATSMATAGLGVYSSAAQASAQNKYQKRRARAEDKAISIQSKQIQQQSVVEKQKSFDEAQQIRSRIRVAAGESGIGLGGTYDAFMRQADFDSAFNEQTIEDNALMNIAAVHSQRTPQAPSTNTTLNAIIGGLTGLSTGMSLGASGMSIYKSAQPAGGTK